MVLLGNIVLVILLFSSEVYIHNCLDIPLEFGFFELKNGYFILLLIYWYSYINFKNEEFPQVPPKFIMEEELLVTTCATYASMTIPIIFMIHFRSDNTILLMGNTIFAAHIFTTIYFAIKYYSIASDIIRKRTEFKSNKKLMFWRCCLVLTYIILIYYLIFSYYQITPKVVEDTINYY